MSIKNFFDGGKQISDSVGAPLNGGLCYFYDPGTTTPKNTYTTSAISVANANPVVLDSSGRANIWLNGNYRAIVKDSSANTIYDEDNINPETTTTVTAISGSTTLVLADKGKILEVNGSGITLTLTAAATLGAGWYVDYISTDASNAFTFGRANSGNTIDGISASLVIYPLHTGRLYVNQAANGFYTQSDPYWLLANICNCRLTLTSATPVTTSDVTAATSVYVTPYNGGRMALYDGSARWRLMSFTELTISVPATTSTMYDVFAYDNAGVVAVETLAWTNDTTRATALAFQNGVYVKSGSTTRRYLGSFRTTGSSGQTEDSAAKRYVWNYYNRVPRFMKVIDTTNTWTYTTATFRQANAAAANQLDCVIGVAEGAVQAEAYGQCTNDTGGPASVTVGVGIDSTTVDSSLIRRDTSCLVNQWVAPIAVYKGVLAAGRHTIVWLEYSQAVGVTTWQGDNGSAVAPQTGIVGMLHG